jgi:hypothetical protein
MYLSARINALMHDMERAGIEIVNLITDYRKAPEIIDFTHSAALRPGTVRKGTE